MTDPILVTGGTGRLGRVLVPRLVAAGHTVRVLSRSPRQARTGAGHDRVTGDLLTGDLLTGDGLGGAVAGAGTVIHCATGNDRTDVEATRNLIAAALRAGRPHLVYVSIVGVDRVGLAYYRAKLECERLLRSSGLPWTVQRATQFHDLVAWMCSVQRWLPAILMPSGVGFQPIDVGEVADRLRSLADAGPQGRADDMGGPEVRAAVDLARTWVRAHGRCRPVLAVPAPGAAFRAYRDGAHLAPERAVGRITFEEYLSSAGLVAGRRG
ncbi:NAD(P)H-binding protein [Kitasatospora sp. NPDC093806]|uniref:SDR family oxidoreductase n=1 Tax=Kitasatospora sp. NPDC093806 TaxID=3155075 RepID=UPI00341447EF